jgi:hypothetical protein
MCACVLRLFPCLGCSGCYICFRVIEIVFFWLLVLSAGLFACLVANLSLCLKLLAWVVTSQHDCFSLRLPGSSLLGLPGPSWAFLGPPGPTWALLGPPGPSWALLDPPGSSWGLLGPSWALLGQEELCLGLPGHQRWSWALWVRFAPTGPLRDHFGVRFGGGTPCFTRVFGFDCGEGVIWGGEPPCFTRVFGFDCGEGLIRGGGPPCFTRVFGFDCGEGLIWGRGPRVLRGFLDLTAARA